MTENYIRGIGRLATDRYDFQNHVDGYDFRHTAAAIDCAVTVDGTPYTTVQAALAAIATYIPYTLSGATNTTLGGIKLAGDLTGGTASVPVVSGLKGTSLSISSLTSGNFLVYNGNWINSNISGDVSGGYASTSVDKIRGTLVDSPLLPNDGEVLVWDNGNSKWISSTPTITMGGDVTGDSATSDVVALTGNGSKIIVRDDMEFASGVNAPEITQDDAPALSDGEDMTISAQTAILGAGGDLIMTGGFGTTGRGAAILQFSEVSVAAHTSWLSGRVLALVPEAKITSTHMPSNSGDLVIYIKDANTVPTASPTSGSVLYSSSGELYTRQSDGDQYALGSYRTVIMDSVEDSGNGTGVVDSTTSTSYSTITGITLTLTESFLADDLVKIDYHGVFGLTGGSYKGYVQITVDGSVVPGTRTLAADASGTGLVGLTGLYTLPSSAASITINVQFAVSNISATLTAYDGTALVAQVIRP